jgi:hypothetical protein
MGQEWDSVALQLQLQLRALHGPDWGCILPQVLRLPILIHHASRDKVKIYWTGFLNYFFAMFDCDCALYIIRFFPISSVGIKWWYCHVLVLSTICILWVAPIKFFSLTCKVIMINNFDYSNPVPVMDIRVSHFLKILEFWSVEGGVLHHFR